MVYLLGQPCGLSPSSLCGLSPGPPGGLSPGKPVKVFIPVRTVVYLLVNPVVVSSNQRHYMKIKQWNSLSHSFFYQFLETGTSDMFNS